MHLLSLEHLDWPPHQQDRKSTRLNSSHVAISYAVFCLKKKRSEEHTSELQSRGHLVCRLLLEKNSRATRGARMIGVIGPAPNEQALLSTCLAALHAAARHSDLVGFFLSKGGPLDSSLFPSGAISH